MNLELALAVGGILLSFALFDLVSGYFVDGIGSLGRTFDVPEAVLGASVAAVGSSLPELFTSLSSLLLEHPVIGMGTIVGSAVFNVTIILAAAGWTRRCSIDRHVIVRDAGFYGLVLVLMTVTILDQQITRLEAALWLGSYGLYFAWLVRDSRRGHFVPREDVDRITHGQAGAYLVGGLVGIGVLSYVLVESSLVVTDAIGLSESVFALLVIAAGTSVPDLFTSVSAAKRGYGSMAMSNAVGSNVFDILVGLGLPLSVLASTTSVEGNVVTSVLILLGSLVLGAGLMKRGHSITRRDAVVLTAFYVGFVVLLVAGVV